MGLVRRLAERVVRTGESLISTAGRIAAQRSVVPAKYVPAVVLLVISCCFLVLQFNDSLFVEHGAEFDCAPVPTPDHVSTGAGNEDPGRALINAIRAARRLASGHDSTVSTPELSAEELEEWKTLYPCESRGPDGLDSFYSRRRHVRSLPANPLWDEVFDEYSKLHRECMRKVGDVTEYFNQRNVSSGCKFVVADITGETGFGNKILVLASSLLYAIVTQRVILIPASTLVPSYMCEPFAGSSWLLSGNRTLPLPPESFLKVWTSDQEIFADIDRRRIRCSAPSVPRAYAAGIRRGNWQPQQRFYCSLEQSAYSQMSFVYLSGCIYTIPKLFATPLFRPALEALFPDMIVATRLLRSAFFPGVEVWNRVRAIDHGYLQPADRRVGVQLRYKGRGLPSFEEMNDVMNPRIVNCLVQNNILPNVTETWQGLSKPSRSPVVQVFIASLFAGFKDHLNHMYGRHSTVTGERIGVSQVSQNGHQEFSVEEDIQAFSEVLLLSFSDQLLVTPLSTLGSVAQAYGALTPWFIEVRPKSTQMDEYKACERGQTIEPCNQYSETKYSCSDDAVVNGKLITDVVPYINNCLPIDHDEGIQLISKFPI